MVIAHFGLALRMPHRIIGANDDPRGIRAWTANLFMAVANAMNLEPRGLVAGAFRQPANLIAHLAGHLSRETISRTR